MAKRFETLLSSLSVAPRLKSGSKAHTASRAAWNVIQNTFSKRPNKVLALTNRRTISPKAIARRRKFLSLDIDAGF